MAVVTMGAIPERTLVQRRDALVLANQVRTFRADLKRDVKRGVAPPAVLMDADDSRLASLKVWDVLLTMPKIGRVKANKILGRAGVSPSKTVGGLTQRQRDALMACCPRLR